MTFFRHCLNSLEYYWLRYVRMPIVYSKTRHWNILDSETSIRYILKHHCSVSRFGDGEFYVLWGGGNGFQEPDARLTARLKQVLTEPIENHIVGLPMPMKDVSGLIDNAAIFWWPYTTRNYYRISPYVRRDSLYVNTQLSRFYYEVREKRYCRSHLELLRQLWQGRDVVIVEGEQTRSGVGNDLYSNARSIRRILGPARNAFDKYDEMLEAIKSNVTRDNLILLSFGMTATVLAYDLAKLGYWAVDLGHLDLEYEWFLRGATDRVAIDGKFTNEVEGGDFVCDCTDEDYLKSIICIIKNDL